MPRTLALGLIVLLALFLTTPRAVAGPVKGIEIPPTIDLDAAAGAATTIPNEFLRGKFLFEIGIARAQAGDRATARALLRQGAELIRKAIDGRKEEGAGGYLAVHLAALQYRAGDRAAAAETFARVIGLAKAIPAEKENRKLDLLQFIARTQAEVGDFASALDTARGLFSSSMEIFVLEDIARMQARSGDVPGALRTAAQVRALGGRAKTRQEADPAVVACHELVHAEMLAEAALNQAGSVKSAAADARKMIQEALRLVDRSLELRTDVGAIALASIALAQAKLGEAARSRETFARALEVTEHIEGFQRPEILAKIAEARWKAGETAEARVSLRRALERARPLKDQFPQVDNLIVQVQIEAGDLDGALETARASQQERAELVIYPEVFRQLVRARAAKIGPRPALEEWWKSVESPLHRAYAILGTAEAATATTIPNSPVQP